MNAIEGLKQTIKEYNMIIKDSVCKTDLNNIEECILSLEAAIKSLIMDQIYNNGDDSVLIHDEITHINDSIQKWIIRISNISQNIKNFEITRSHEAMGEKG